MLICNARKKCPKKEECPHAIKHFTMENCAHAVDKGCPDAITDVKRKIWCKPCGASLERVKRKSRAKADKIRQPINQYEAQQALYQLKNMAVVEYRMSGGQLTSSIGRKFDLKEIVQGLTVVHIKSVFPDYRERGLDRYQVIHFLTKEIDRQFNLRQVRWDQKRNTDRLVRTNGERERIVNRKIQNLTETILKKNYSLKHSRKYGYYIYTEKTNKEQPTFICRKSGLGASYTLRIPQQMVAMEIQSHLIICDYYDKKLPSFPCFALIGGRYGWKLVPTMVNDKKFVDPMFSTGETKMEIKAKLLMKEGSDGSDV